MLKIQLLSLPLSQPSFLKLFMSKTVAYHKSYALYYSLQMNILRAKSKVTTYKQYEKEANSAN